MKKQIFMAASLMLAGTLAGCGGSSSGTGAGTVAAVSGKVADGYLVNATVFMDKNGNYKLDAGEPSAMTDANGNYTLMVSPSDIGRYPIVAMATKGVTMDRDTNQTVTNSYLLSMHQSSVSGMAGSNFISPMSSELREMMETGKYATMLDAMNALGTRMKASAGTNMMGDFIAGQNGTLHTTAQNMATLMGSQMPQLFTAGGGTTVDVNRYRGMMGAIFYNISSIKGAGTQGTMPTLITDMSTFMSGIITGMPYRNMSSSYSGMMGGSFGGTMMGSGTTSGGTMMGSGTTTSGTTTMPGPGSMM